MTAAAPLDPDLVVFDILIPSLDGIETARRLKRAACRAKLLFLSVHEGPDSVRAALRSGGSRLVPTLCRPCMRLFAEGISPHPSALGESEG